MRRRYKVLAPAQVTATDSLIGGEDLFIQLFVYAPIREYLGDRQPSCSSKRRADHKLDKRQAARGSSIPSVATGRVQKSNLLNNAVVLMASITSEYPCQRR